MRRPAAAAVGFPKDKASRQPGFCHRQLAANCDLVRRGPNQKCINIASSSCRIDIIYISVGSVYTPVTALIYYAFRCN